MGRATILSGGTDGLYTVAVDYGTPRMTVKIAQITEEVNRLSTQYTEQHDQYLLESAKIPGLIVDLDAAIDAYAIDANDDTREAVTEATRAHSRQLSITELAKRKADQLQLAWTSAEKERAKLQNIITSEDVSVWCVDLTETATGEVATIEVPGEPQRILIAAGGQGHTASDGDLMARGVMSPEQVFYNAAILPGVQRHAPTFRVGTITALDTGADTASVELDAASSSANNLPINAVDVLWNVPIEYMTCNASAFEVGDRVIVHFEGNSWFAPKVIGFLQNPKACAGVLVGMYGSDYILIADLNTSTGVPVFIDSINYDTNKDSGGILKFDGKYWTIESQRTGYPISTSYKTLHSHLGDVLTLSAQVYSPSLDSGEIVGIFMDASVGASATGADHQKKIIAFNQTTGASTRSFTIPYVASSSYYYFSADAAGGLITLGGYEDTIGYQVVVMDHMTGAEVYRITPPSGTVLGEECVAMTSQYFAYFITYGWLGAYSVVRVHSLTDGLMVTELQIPSSQSLQAITMVGKKVILQGNQGGPSSYNGDTMIYELDDTNTLVHQGTYSLFDSLIGSIYFLSGMGGK